MREVARRASCAFVLVSHMEALASTLHPARQLDETQSAPPEDGTPSASQDHPKAQAAPTHPGAPPEQLAAASAARLKPRPFD